VSRHHGDGGAGPQSGETLASPGELGWDRSLRASITPAAPFFMLESNRLLTDVPAGAPITLDMVEEPQDSAVWSLRRRQDGHFHVMMAD